MNGKKNLLITGATGFIGSNLVNEILKDETFKVAIIVRNLDKAYQIFGNNVTYIQYESKSFKKGIIEFQPNLVIHLAAYSTGNDDIENIKELIDSNILFLSILLDALKEIKIELFVNTGSFAEYYYNDGILNPAYFYAATKTATRSILKYYQNLTNMKCCTLIPYTVYGGINKNKKILDIIFDSLDEIEPVKMTQGEQISDFVHIKDVVNFYIKVIKNTNLVQNSGDYHIGTGRAYSLREVSKIVEKVSNKKTNITWGAINYRPLDMMRAVAPIYKLEKELSWTPTIAIEEGIKLIWKIKAGEDINA